MEGQDQQAADTVCQQPAEHGSIRQQQQQGWQEPWDLGQELTSEFMAEWYSAERSERDCQWWSAQPQQQQQQQDSAVQQPTQLPQGSRGRAEQQSRDSHRHDVAVSPQKVLLAPAQEKSWQKQAEKLLQQLQRLQLEHQLVSAQLAAAQMDKAVLRLQLAQHTGVLQHLGHVLTSAITIIGTVPVANNIAVHDVLLSDTVIGPLAASDASTQQGSSSRQQHQQAAGGSIGANQQNLWTHGSAAVAAVEIPDCILEDIGLAGNVLGSYVKYYVLHIGVLHSNHAA